MQVLPSTAETPTNDKKPTMPNKTHAHRIFGWKVYKKNCSHYWFLDTHFAVSFWVKIDDVVTAMVVPTVH